MYARTDLDAIREQVDMVKFLEERGTTFRKTGVNFQALCPLHSERSPSFSVRPLNNTFHCFGCGKSGDIFSLMQELDLLSFAGAVQALAEYAELTLSTVEDDPAYRHKQRLYRICQFAADWFREQFLALEDDHPAQQNLRDRQLLYPVNTAGYGALVDPIVGFAPARGLVEDLTREKFEIDEIVEAGLATRQEDGRIRETFRNRLMWTIQDTSGKPIGFSGRKVLAADLGRDDIPKYKNSPQTPLYNKSGALLGLAWAKKEIVRSQRVFVVEGQTDVMALRAVGIDNVVASCGTAFGTDHAQILTRLAATGRDAERFQIIFCFDGDAAGVKAAKTVFEKNKGIQLNSFVAKLDKYDPCDMRLKEGDEALTAALSHQVSLTEFVLAEELKTWDIKNPEGKIAFLTQAQHILAQITNSIQRDSYIRKLALWTGLSVEEVRPVLGLSGVQLPQRPATQAHVAGDSLETKILAFGLQYPDVFNTLAEKARISADMFPAHQDLAQEILEHAPLNYGNARTAELLHLDLQVDETRAADMLRNMVVAYYRLLATQEFNQTNMTLADTDGDATEEDLFMRTLMEQDRIKTKYTVNF